MNGYEKYFVKVTLKSNYITYLPFIMVYKML